jgi:glycerophosphoryl diester phosphodiesterase
MGAKPNKGWEIVDDAIKMNCDKVQLYAPFFNQEMVDKAHEHGIICTVFYADEPKKAIEYLEMGIDTILTNDYLNVSNAVNEWKKHNA